MSKRKGLSYEEKRTRMAELFYETKEIYTLKELEKVASKQKGITMQTVKEILDSLVADEIVQTDKIGTSNYFWSFPSQASVVRVNKINKHKDTIAELNAQEELLDEQIKESSEGKASNKQRSQLLEQLSKLEHENQELNSELAMYAANDPAVIEAKKLATKKAKDDANRWTDNVLSLTSYIKNRFNMDINTIYQQFDIPEEFDNL